MNLSSIILSALTLIGGLGLFLYGMKLMSEALQKVAGNRLRSILATMTKNKWLGILTGIGVTAIIQSSSATTVMVVSFVNAGLLNLSQAFGVIMGANIGTTATAWIVSLFGFKISMEALAVPLIALIVPLLFSKRQKLRYFAEMVLGFSLLFMGIGILQSSVPDVQNYPQVMSFIARFSGWGYGSILLFMLISTVMTIIVQSSSAMMAITLVMCCGGMIGMDMAAAMVLGQNIGTTITSIIASLPANRAAKQAAFSHLLFNVIGVILALLFFYPLLHLTELIGGFEDAPNAANIAFSLSIFHTLFNIGNTLILVWFAKYIVQFVEWAFRDRHKQTMTVTDSDNFNVSFITTGMLSTAELSILQAEKEVQLFAERIRKMYSYVPDILEESHADTFPNKYNRLKEWEDKADTIETDIAKYVYSLNTGRLSPTSKAKTQEILRIISELESIADSCYKIACVRKHNLEQDIHLNQTMRDELSGLVLLVTEATDRMVGLLEKADNTITQEDIAAVRDNEIRINTLRDKILKINLIENNEGRRKYEESMYVQNIANSLELIGDYILNIVEARIKHKIFSQETLSN